MKKALETTVLALLRGLIVFALTACALPVLAQPGITATILPCPRVNPALASNRSSL
ncbi:MAG: hypothetical protein IPN33_12885 [Saprospiraceae bacterium]|nr:hypothetical protein [Saprospiraceae bacterium]